MFSRVWKGYSDSENQYHLLLKLQVVEDQNVFGIGKNIISYQ